MISYRATTWWNVCHIWNFIIHGVKLCLWLTIQTYTYMHVIKLKRHDAIHQQWHDYQYNPPSSKLQICLVLHVTIAWCSPSSIWTSFPHSPIAVMQVAPLPEYWLTLSSLICACMCLYILNSSNGKCSGYPPTGL